MEIIVVAVVVIALLVMTGILINRNYRYKVLSTVNRWYAVTIVLLLAVVLICDLLLGEGVLSRLPNDMLPAVVCMSLLTMSLLVSSVRPIIFSITVIVEVFMSVFYLLCIADVLKVPTYGQMKFMSGIMTIAYVIVFLYFIWYKIRDIHALMQTASVWSWLTFSVDVFYLLSLIVLVILNHFFMCVPMLMAVLCLLMTGLMLAFMNRINLDSAFALMHRHEQTIVESMKISSVDASVSSSGEEYMYKEIFERVQSYFEEEKPFLNGNLTINDVVAEVFSNKVYISRAISHFTGRNFCQYVNYHRVMYAMDCYRANPALKVSELWPLCGFNTIVSFNMAFRLFMNENPSDWCRKEKMR